MKRRRKSIEKKTHSFHGSSPWKMPRCNFETDGSTADRSAWKVALGKLDPPPCHEVAHWEPFRVMETIATPLRSSHAHWKFLAHWNLAVPTSLTDHNVNHSYIEFPQSSRFTYNLTCAMETLAIECGFTPLSLRSELGGGLQPSLEVERQTHRTRWKLWMTG